MSNIKSNVIDVVRVTKLHYPVENYKYDAQIFRSVDGGKNFYHCGNGRYFKSKKEARQYKNSIEKGGK